MHPPVPHQAHVGDLAFEPLVLVALPVAVLAYWGRAGHLAAEGRPVPRLRQLSFAAGLLLVAIASAPPLAHEGERLLAAHMAQHLLLVDLAALLLVAGLTGPVVQPVLALRGLRWLRGLAHPLIALPAWALILYAWHLPVLYQAAAASPAVHALEHASFICGGMLVWAPLFGPLPRPAWFGDAAGVAYILAVRVAGAVLANVLLFAGEPVYPDYAASARAAGTSPLDDQAAAGGIMLAESALVTLAALAWLLVRTLRRTEESRRLVELARDRGVELDLRRARRAVAAGREGALRARILGAEPDGRIDRPAGDRPRDGPAGQSPPYR